MQHNVIVTHVCVMAFFTVFSIFISSSNNGSLKQSRMNEEKLSCKIRGYRELYKILSW